MKKKIVIALGTAICALGMQSFAKKSPKATYSFPPEMRAEVRTEYQKMCDKGQILYEMNCAKCHNVKVNGRWVVPDFTRDQVNGYEIRVGNRAHEGALTEESISSEEIGLIATFLLYKDPAGGQVADAFGGKLSEKDKED